MELAIENLEAIEKSRVNYVGIYEDMKEGSVGHILKVSIG